MKSRIGEVRRANNGLNMEIIGYNNSHDITIRFEDGTVVTNKHYSEFVKGSIRNPNVRSEKLKHERVGEYGVSSNNESMTIIAYRNANDVDIKFGDGTVVKRKTYANFNKGTIKKPNKY